MNYNFFTHFITILYSTKSCNANTQRRMTLWFLFLWNVNPFRIVWHAFHSLISQPQMHVHWWIISKYKRNLPNDLIATTRLYDHLVITTILSIQT